MEVQLRQIVSSWESVNKLAQCELPPSAALRFARFVRAALPEFEAFEKHRKELIERLGAANERGDIVVPPEKMGQFEQDINAMLDQVLTLPDPQLTEADVADVKGLSAYHFFGIVWLFDHERKQE
jgi:hypothetical protein